MSTPQFENRGSSYLFTWEEEKLIAEVSRIRVHKDGRVTCRILWSTNHPSYKSHLWQKDNFNLAAANNPINRRELTSKYKEKVDWSEILETLSVNSIAENERGEPVETLETTTEVQRPPYILKPFLVDGFPTVFFGDPSSGKTNIALLLATCLMLPWSDNPFYLEVPPKSVKCLYLDWETGKTGILWQLTAIQRGMGLDYLELPYRRCYAPLHEEVPQIQEYITETKAKVVIIDSLGLAAGGELKDTAAPLLFYRALGQLKTTALILAHTPKERENRTIYGNRFFEAEARSIWEIQKQQEVGESEMSIGLFNRKPLPWDKIMPAIGFKMAFSENGTGTVISPQDPKTIAEFLERLSMTLQITNLLKDGQKRTPKQIAEELHKSANEIRQVLYRMMHRPKPQITKIGEAYGLAYQGELPENENL